MGLRSTSNHGRHAVLKQQADKHCAIVGVSLDGRIRFPLSKKTSARTPFSKQPNVAQ